MEDTANAIDLGVSSNYDMGEEDSRDKSKLLELQSENETSEDFDGDIADDRYCDNDRTFMDKESDFDGKCDRMSRPFYKNGKIIGMKKYTGSVTPQMLAEGTKLRDVAHGMEIFGEFCKQNYCHRRKRTISS